MSLRTIRTAVAEYDDGLDGVIAVDKLTPDNGDPFMVLHSPDSSDGGIVVGTAEQARQLANAIRAGMKEIWDT